MEKIKIKVPATSANLGSGFDCVGIAFKLYNVFEFEKTESGLSFEGCAEKYANENNLAYKAYRAVCEKIGESSNVKIKFCDTGVPVSRGLGSSATLICAGAYAANALFGKKLNYSEILEICTEIEGHPDNVAPALLGSLCASVSDCGEIKSVKFPVSKKLFFTALIPDFEVSTSEARAVLPKEIQRTDAIYNMSRVALLPYAFSSGYPDLIKAVTKDKIHEQYRKKLFKNVSDVEKICYGCGALTFNISGAGSTCLCISLEDISAELSQELAGIENEWRVVPLEVSEDGVEEIRE
ncbi:MAG: homoserine kinase [Eubacteriales bacterium]